MVNFYGKRVLLLGIFLALLISGCASQQAPIKESREAAKARYQEAIKLARSGKKIKALESANSAVRLDPGYAPGHELLALMSQQTGQPDQAEASFRNALEINAKSPSLLNNYGNFQCQRKNYGAAIDLFKRAANISSNPKPEIAYTNAGLCALRGHDKAGAKQLFQQAIEIRADQAVAVYQLAQLALEEGETLAANSWLEQYLRHYPHTAKTLLLGAKIESQLRNPLGLQDYLDKLQSGFPNSAEASEAQQLTRSNTAATLALGSTVFDGSWVKNRNPDFFTVQIATSKKKEPLKILANKLGGIENAIFLGSNAGRPQFTLVSGSYPNFQSAQAALLKVKQKITAHRPWIRNFAGIQATF